MAMTLKQLCMLQPLNWLKDKYIKQGKTMKFEELKKYKGGKVVKPRDPNWKQMQDIKKSGAAGSHGDKTKIIPRKAKHQDDLTEADVKYLTELAFLPLLIPALGAAVRLGAPHVLRFLGRKGAKDILK